MELYLDSVDFKEIEEAFKLGFLTGLTTTPTFMHKQGIKDIDGAIVKLSTMVPILQIEALGDTAEQILAEAERQLALGLDPKKTVFKIPVSNEGVRACKMLRDKGYMVNIHLVYTLAQAYMAMAAGATYVCPLVGRWQDQGHDAVALIQQCVETVKKYNYNTKIMFSSVRNAEHVRNAIAVGVHTVTVPWSIMKNLTNNHFTTIGTQQFIRDTDLMTVRVKDIMSSNNPLVKTNTKVFDALTLMTDSGAGAVSIVDEAGQLKGIFTDGDLRRSLKAEGQATLDKTMQDFISGTAPHTIQDTDLLYDVVNVFKQTQVDNLIVLSAGKPVGMVDVQDFMKRNLIG
ncbi:MAG: CBS domain-containing protein [Cytophagales bacterium]|nr:MAG: CBS domain-containing protein [Cytophagales bacterium]